jgi:hypothetical protein
MLLSLAAIIWPRAAAACSCVWGGEVCEAAGSARCSSRPSDRSHPAIFRLRHAGREKATVIELKVGDDKDVGTLRLPDR